VEHATDNEKLFYALSDLKENYFVLNFFLLIVSM
jgi:hypothetical protein